MKLVTIDMIVDAPVGTVFTKYPLGVHEMLIKGTNVPEHYFQEQRLSDAKDDIFGELFDPACEERTGASFALDVDYPDIDDTHKIDTWFVMYEHDDVEAVIARLQKALADSKKATINQEQ